MPSLETDIYKWILGGAVALLVGIVSFLSKLVLSNRRSASISEVRIKALEDSAVETSRTKITKEDVREVIAAELARRDLIGKERREEWDARRLLEIRAAVAEGVKECRIQSRCDLERMVPMIVREFISRTQTPSGSGEVPRI